MALNERRVRRNVYAARKRARKDEEDQGVYTSHGELVLPNYSDPWRRNFQSRVHSLETTVLLACHKARFLNPSVVLSAAKEHQGAAQQIATCGPEFATRCRPVGCSTSKQVCFMPTVSARQGQHWKAASFIIPKQSARRSIPWSGASFFDFLIFAQTKLLKQLN